MYTHNFGPKLTLADAVYLLSQPLAEIQQALQASVDFFSDLRTNFSPSMQAADCLIEHGHGDLNTMKTGGAFLNHCHAELLLLHVSRQEGT